MARRQLLNRAVTLAAIMTMGFLPKGAEAVYDCRNPYEGALDQSCPQIQVLTQSHAATVTGIPIGALGDIMSWIQDAIDTIRRQFSWDGQFQVDRLSFPAIRGDNWRYIGYTPTEAEVEHIIGDPATDGTDQWCGGSPAAHQCPNCPEGTEPKWYTCLTCCAAASGSNPRPGACEPGNPGGFSPDFSPEASCCDCKPGEASLANPLMRLAPPQDATRIQQNLDEYRKNYSKANLQISAGDGTPTPIDFSLPLVYGLKRAFDDPVLKTGLWDWLFKNSVSGTSASLSRAGRVAGITRSCELPAEGLPQTKVCFSSTLSNGSDPYPIPGGTGQEPSVSWGDPVCGATTCSVTVSAGASSELEILPQFSEALDYFGRSTDVLTSFLPPKELEDVRTTSGEGAFEFTFDGTTYEEEMVIPLAGIHEAAEQTFHNYGMPPNWQQ